ncbi:MAG: hypothetical protein WA051_02480 [Minisyncoccia bacterium]
MTSHLEVERKFVVENFHAGMIPADAEMSEITQVYLVSDNRAVEKRVRAELGARVRRYTHTTKEDSGVAGIRRESEKEITLPDFQTFLSLRDVHTRAIVKRRYKFRSGKHVLELDVYELPISNLVVLEVEVGALNEQVEFPEGWVLREVTGDSMYSNRSIALGSVGP